MSRTVFSAVCVALLAAAIGPAAGQRLIDKAQRDDIAVVHRDDPEMAAAMDKARATLPDFLALARAPRRSMSNFAVKVAIGGPHTEAEYFWIASFKEKDGRFTGRINNTPRSVKSVKIGQTIAFSQDEIVDWLYLDNGKMKGNYTACVLLKREPGQAEAFKKQFGLECDL